MLWDSTKAYSLISKPEKIYLHNTNLAHMVPEGRANLGNLRETFFMNQLATKHSISSTKKEVKEGKNKCQKDLNLMAIHTKKSQKGDFLVENKFVFEVGGESKTFIQIADIPNSFLAVDDELIGTGNRIPLWLFGFLG